MSYIYIYIVNVWGTSCGGHAYITKMTNNTARQFALNLFFPFSLHRFIYTGTVCVATLVVFWPWALIAPPTIHVQW